MKYDTILSDEEWDSLVTHQDSIVFNENILLTNEEYERRLKREKLQGKLELFDEILSNTEF